jgi:hypothetical protein
LFLKIKKQMKIVKFGKSLANGEGITVLDIIEGKIKQEEKSLSWFRRKATDELDDILTIAKKRKLNHFREF